MAYSPELFQKVRPLDNQLPIQELNGPFGRLKIWLKLTCQQLSLALMQRFIRLIYQKYAATTGGADTA